jgi:N-sulfoglucosamine sulfohydrolase
MVEDLRQQLRLDAGCYRDVDDQETLLWLIKEASDSAKYGALLKLIVGRHPAERRYDIQKDPDCLHNLATAPEHAAT